MNHRVAIDEADSGHDAVLEFLFGNNTDLAEGRARQLGEEARHDIQPGTVLGRESELEAAGRPAGNPAPGLPRDMSRMTVEDQVDRGIGGIGVIEKLEEFDELAALPVRSPVVTPP